MASTPRLATLLLPLAATAAGASAQVTRDSVHVLEPILVQADRPSPVGAHLHRIDLSATAIPDLVSVLEREAGIYAVRTGTGVAAALRVRGTDDLQTAVLLDGIALRDPHTGSLDPSLVPRVVLESADIGLGGAASDPAAPTGPGLGGAIRLSTPAVGRCSGVRTEFSAGAYGALRAGSRVAAAPGGVCLLLAAEHGQERGDFPVPAIAGAPDHRLGAERSHGSVFARFSGRNSGVRWAITGWRSASEAGLPGPANSAPRDADMAIEAWRGAVSVHRTSSTIDLGLELQAGHGRSLFRDGAAGFEARSRATTLQASASLTTERGSWLLETRAATGVERSLLPEPETQRRVVFDASARHAGRRGRIALGLAVGEWPGGGFRVAPRISASAGDRWAVRASAARAVRVPTLAERTWIPGGNPDLRPETGWSADVGARFDGSTGWAAGLGAFVNVLDDRIVWQPRLVAPGLDVWTPRNVGRTLGVGFEPDLRHERKAAGGLLRLRLAGTVSRTTDRSDRSAASYGHPLRHLPVSVWTAVAEWSRDRGAIRVDARRVGRRPVTTDGSLHLGAFTVVDLSATAVPGRSVRVRAALHNAFDARYAMLPHYPMPGRHVTATLTLDLFAP